MNLFYHIGRYFILLGRVFRKPEKMAMYRSQYFRETVSIGVGSLGIISIISLFMGAVVTIQTASNIESSWIPEYIVGYMARQSVILEFSSTMMSLILAGKVGSSIASELGTMRITEQIDALEIMGINSAAYLVLPKILAAVTITPFLMLISMFLGVFGAWAAGVMTGLVDSYDFIYGVKYDFEPFDIIYATIKMLFFAFVIASIPAYHGFYVNGGALEVGAASTRAVVYTSIVILMLNVLLTQVLLV